MGLDMFAGSADPNAVSRYTPELVLRKGAKEVDLQYWRKHHDLHGWMENLYRERGGKKSFNCVRLHLTEVDLDRLEADIKAGKLPHTTGFFFGDNPPDEESNAVDLEFIDKARQRIKQGAIVFYDSWW